MVTERERRELAAIERRLTADDPALARSLRTLRRPPRHLCDRELMVLLPLLLLTTAVVLRLPVVCAVCGLLALSALVLHARSDIVHR